MEAREIMLKALDGLADNIKGGMYAAGDLIYAADAMQRLYFALESDCDAAQPEEEEGELIGFGIDGKPILDESDPLPVGKVDVCGVDDLEGLEILLRTLKARGLKDGKYSIWYGIVNC